MTHDWKALGKEKRVVFSQHPLDGLWADETLTLTHHPPSTVVLYCVILLLSTHDLQWVCGLAELRDSVESNLASTATVFHTQARYPSSCNNKHRPKISPDSSYGGFQPRYSTLHTAT